jgi:UDP-glucose 4-epimerase
MAKSCLITGATGLIGSYFIQEAINDCELFVITKNQANHLSKKVHQINADLSDSAFVSKLPSQIDAIVHLAQSNHHKEFPNKALDIFSINAESTLRLLDFAKRHRVKTFIYASSGVVYGSSPDPISEDAPLKIDNKLGFYYLSKLAGELLVEQYSNAFNIIILRFFFVYGRNQKEGMLIPRLTQSIMQNKSIILQKQDGIKINPIHVSDAAKAVNHALNLNQSEKINIGGKEVLSLREICEVIGEVVGKKPQFEIDTLKEPNHLIGDISKMNHFFGIPKMTFKEGIKFDKF